MQRVHAAFSGHFKRGDEVGAAVCVYLGDDLAVDLWGGLADPRTGRAWQRDTPCSVFSCTKALTATCALHLWEHGAYELEMPVTTWWPEFGQAGKDRVTAAQLLSHQAGLPAFDTTVSVADAADPARLADLLAAQAPVWEPGTAHGYHALTFGWLAGEIVRRTSGHTTGEYLRDHIAGPHGLGIWLGPPDDVIAQAAKLTRHRPGAGRAGGGGGERGGVDMVAASGGAAASAPGQAAAGATRPSRDRAPAGPGATMAAALRDPASLLFRTMNNPDTNSVPGGSNNPQIIRAGWPASGALASAAGLAGFYRQLIAGRIISRDVLATAVAARVRGRDQVLSIESSFGLGFMRPAWTFLTPRAGQDSAFGHTGVGGAIGLADPAHGIAMAYVPNLMSDDTSGGLRAFRLVEAVYKCVA
jgi:CubicO group peptidase (beta-lactamase class C family)